MRYGRYKSEKLRNAGLPRQILDDDFLEVEARNRILHAELLAKLEALENGPWKDIEFPWSAARRAWKADRAAGVPEEPFLATIDPTPPGIYELNRTIHSWHRLATGKEQEMMNARGRKYRAKKRGG